MTLCTVVYIIAYLFAVTTRERERERERERFSGNVLQNMHVNDDLLISPSFITTLVVSKSNRQIGPEGYTHYCQLDP